MKKNVFSRTIAVLASMTVLGAASMLSASAKGIKGGTVEVEPGTTEVAVPLYMFDIESKGCAIIITAGAPEIKDIEPDGCLDYEGDAASGIRAVYVKGSPYSTSKPFETLAVTLDENAEPGEYPIEISIEKINEGGEELDGDGFDAESAVIVVKAPETEPETEATTEAPTAAPTTAAATTTTPKKGASPKTGSTGVAVAVAGLVTAGATAVVLKKKH